MRWFIGYLPKEELQKPLWKRNYQWVATFRMPTPNMSRETALWEAVRRGCPLSEGGMLVWYSCHPRNVDGKPARLGGIQRHIVKERRE
ncbi:MAG: hypothetical protein DRG39_05680 [Deltaproteobacteria bacterium]|nr:MAG: hypothetical protein DRG39_05680 [Deltaproteobacteria bacterium]